MFIVLLSLTRECPPFFPAPEILLLCSNLILTLTTGTFLAIVTVSRWEHPPERDGRRSSQICNQSQVSNDTRGLIRVQISFRKLVIDKSKSSVMANHGQLLSPEAGYDPRMDDAGRHTPDVRLKKRLEIL